MAKTFLDTINKTLLTQEEMQTLDRDLVFRPASKETAQTLTSVQVDFFNQNGYLLPLPLFDSQEIAGFRQHFDKILEKTLSQGGDSYSIVDPHLTDRSLYDLMFDTRIVAYIKDLVGPDIVCWSSHFFCKLPHDDTQVAWHQDAYYWPFTPASTVSVWLAIDDADRDNACMEFVSGSHRIGSIPHRLSRVEEKNVLRVTVDGIETHGKIVDVTLRAGQISLHADTLLHGSGANQSDRRRCGLTLRYGDANMQNLKDWAKNGVMICGKDGRAQWGNPKRPM